PITETISPRLTSILTRPMAWTPPKCLETSWILSSASVTMRVPRVPPATAWVEGHQFNGAPSPLVAAHAMQRWPGHRWDTRTTSSRLCKPSSCRNLGGFIQSPRVYVKGGEEKAAERENAGLALAPRQHALEQQS